MNLKYSATTGRPETLLFLSLMVVVLLLAFWLRVENLGQYPPGISNDEAVNTIDAFHIIRTGNFPMYEDQGRPEPLFRLFQAVGAGLFGPSVWAFRITSVLFGALTVATGYWSARECLRDVRPHVRRIAAISAAAVLAVALGHITVSRSTYRAVPQPLFTFLFTGFLLRGLRTTHYRDFVLSGISLAAALYTYTAALVLPAAVIAVGLHLLIFRRKAWREWLPRLIVLGAVVGVLMIPVGLLLLDRPESVIGRASTVGESQGSWDSRLEIFVAQFFTRGDENPQYNVARAPLLPPGFAWLFAAGLLALIARLRQPSTALIAALLLLSAIPVILADEITHGLRVIGEFAAIPLIVGAGVASILTLVEYVPRLSPRIIIISSLTLLSALTLSNGLDARQTYADYWEHAEAWNPWRVHGMQLEHGEWFFRPDRRDFAQWLTEQDMPLLVPLEELNQKTTRTWLLADYPNVNTEGDNFTLPGGGVRLVVPWSLEKGDLMRNTRHYALLCGDTITLLPPLSAETHAALLADIDDAEVVTCDEGNINLLAHIRPIPDDFVLIYESYAQSGDSLATFGDGELQLVRWRGPDTLDGAGQQTLTITLEWSPLRQIGHEYWSYLQLQTQDHEKIAGDDVLIWRWLFPTSIWQGGDIVSDVHTLNIPGELEPGAYRLVTGLYVYVDEPIPAYNAIGDVVDNSVTIGWLKVPQPDSPAPEDTAIPVDATLDDTFALRYADASVLDDGHINIQLYWESLVERPNIDATVFVHLLDENGELAAQSDIRPWNGQYPTFIWDEGEIVQTDHILDIGEAAVNELTVTAGMYTFPDIVNLTVQQNGEDVPESRITLGNLAALLQEN